MVSEYRLLRCPPQREFQLFARAGRMFELLWPEFLESSLIHRNATSLDRF